jgi:hypothetical protein
VATLTGEIGEVGQRAFLEGEAVPRRSGIGVTPGDDGARLVATFCWCC